MIRVDEVVSARPESRYALGLYTTTLLLGAATTWIGLNTAFASLSLWVNVSVPAAFGLVLGLVFALRPALADSMRSLSHGEMIAGWLVSAALFACASVVFGRWLPLAGLLALQIPALFTLVTERGYARYYVLCGLTVALSLGDVRTPTPLSIGVLAFFLALLVLTMAFENFYFGLENAPAGAQVGISSWLPLHTGLARFLLAAAVTAPLAWLTPVPHLRLEQKQGFEVAPRTRGTLDVSFTLFEAFAYTMVLLVLLIMFGALIRWLRAKRRRKREELMPESVGTPIGGLQPLMLGETPPPPPDPTTPLGRIICTYEQFATGIAKRGRPRKPSDTPEEFREAVVTTAAVPDVAADAITRRFEDARYSPEDPSERQAHEFEMLVEDTLARLTGTGASDT